MKLLSTLFGAALAGAAMSFSAASAASVYSIKPLEAAPGQTDAFALGINSSGQIVGYTVDADGFSHGAMWNAVAGALTPLPNLSSANPISEAYRINNAGIIVGKAHTDDNSVHATYWNASGAHDIGTLTGAGISFAEDVNENGVIVGSSTAAHGQHAFTWTAGGGMVDNGSTLPTSNLGFAGWNAVNNAGQLAGTAYVLLSPYKASKGQIGDTQPTIISPAGQFSTGMALAINEAGTIVGYQNGSTGNPHAAIFNGDGTFQDLGHLGLGESWAEDINNNGLIVGRAFGDDGTGNFVQKAMFYENGQMYELLSQLQNPTGWSVLFQASGVNDLGQIVGVGIYNDEIRTYVATPVPEPTTFGLMLCGASALLARRRK